MVLRNSGVTPKGAYEFVHELQDIAEVHTFAELLKFEEIDPEYQYLCGIVSGKLQALNRFGFDEWEIDDLKLNNGI
ncbi:MAG: hypothetical protein EOP06_29705 [Proteobacteria bacterium]|nr:MAG: hypothetical protein EOP06_29705 [Pseudomonadota bacterium]